MKESDVSNLIRLEASRLGIHLFRNNVGATYTHDGSFIRYGLANESKSMNSLLKSADLIGIRPILIEPWMVGTILGQFVSREIKNTSWKEDNSPRSAAQRNWRDLIIRLGGDATIGSI